MAATETIIYANPAFERLAGRAPMEFLGRSWESPPGRDPVAAGRGLGAAIAGGVERVGIFKLEPAQQDIITVKAYSNIIVQRPAKSNICHPDERSEDGSLPTQLAHKPV